MGLLLCFSICLLGGPLFAQQNSVTVTVQVLPPYSNKIQDYIGNKQKQAYQFQEQIIVTLQNNNLSSSQEVKLIGKITGNNGMSAQVNGSFQPARPIVLPPGGMKVLSGAELGEVNRNLREDDILYQGISQSQIMRTGLLPEGAYQVCMQAFDYQTNRPLSPSAPAGCSTPIPVAYPDPPVIAYPFDGMDILTTDPQALNISWAPSPSLGSGIKYRLRIVELNEVHANPYDLMEQTRISYYEEDNIETTSLFYGQSKPSLKEGHTYAIRVQAYDPYGELQIKNNGWSEIHLFHYVSSLDGGIKFSDTDYITLVPGFLRLVNLGKIQSEERGGGRMYNGAAQLEITSPGQPEPDLIPARVKNLHVQKGDPATALVLSGSVEAGIEKSPQALNELRGLVEVKSLFWQAGGSGLQLSGNIQGPDGKTYAASGALQITQNGVYGKIAATADAQNPFFSFGEKPVALKITELALNFPGGRMESNGQLILFGEEGREQSSLVSFQDLASATPASINVQLKRKIPLTQNAEMLELYVENVFGQLNPDFEDLSLDYDLEMLSQIGLKNLNEDYCGVDMMLRLRSDKDMEARIAGANCLASQINIPLWPAVLSYSNLSVNQLDYHAATNSWDFALSVDGQLSFPVFDGFSTSQLEGLVIDKNGLQLPAIHYKGKSGAQLNKAAWGDLLVTLSEFEQGPITLPLFDGEPTGPQDWDFTFKARASLADQQGIPSCLKGKTLSLQGGKAERGKIFAHIESQDVGNCSWDFGAGYALNFNSIGGSLTLQLQGPDYSLVGEGLNLDLDFLLGEPFSCAGEEQLEVPAADLRLKNGFSGTLENIVPPCALAIGPFTASVHQSTVQFQANKRSGQQAFMEGEAKLNYKSLNTTGTFSLNLMTGEFSRLNFNINQPFILDLPAEDGAVMSFEIQQAKISEEGLLIDGRNKLLLEGQRIRATFDQLLVDVSSNQIKSGSVIFDSNFAFEAAIGNNIDLAFQAVPFDHRLTASPALLMQLAGNIGLDSAGIRSNGEAQASIHFDDIQFDSLKAVYRQDFSLGFFPFGIRSGKVEFYHQEQRIAYADPTGFYPDVSGLGNRQAFIPELIPLPTVEVAYIRIKQNDQLLVNVSTDSLGNSRISTRTGQPLQLVVPALQGGRALAPSVAVEFNDLLLEGNNGSVIGGSVVASIPENDPAFDLQPLGIPVNPNQIAFGVNAQGGANVSSLFVRGTLNLFEQNLGPDGTVVLGIQSDGILRGNFDLQGMNSAIPLVENSGKVKLAVSNISGNFNMPLLSQQTSSTNYSLTFDSEFQLMNVAQEMVVGADLSATYQPGGLNVHSFHAHNNLDTARIELGNYFFQLDRITSLTLDYSPGAGVDFTAGLDCSFGLSLANGEDFNFPLKNIELNSLEGFVIPAQDIHSGTFPGFTPPELNFGKFHLKAITFRLPAMHFNWLSWRSGDPLNFLPKLDLELSFPDFQYSAPEFSQASVTLQDMGFENGILTGALLPFSFDGDGAALPLGGDLSFHVIEIEGSLFPTAEGQQGFDISLNGKLQYPQFFQDSGDACVEPEIAISMDREANFSGLIQNFTPCGQLKYGPLSLAFNSSELHFEVIDDQQYASLAGSATALVERENQQPVTATGNIALDLIRGELISGSILLTGPFNWAYPADDPLFTFTVQTARIDSSGFVFNGAGALETGNASSNVSFNDLTFALANGHVTRGNAHIHNSFALDVAFSPTQWSMEDPAVPSTVDPGMRLVMPSDLLLDRTGLTVNDSSSALLRFGGQEYNLLTVQFDQFKLGLNQSVRVRRGVANLFMDEGDQQIRLGHYDSTGFHPDYASGLIDGMMPDTLGLPTKDVAYIVLRDENNTFVNITSDSRGEVLNTSSPLPLVITAFDASNPVSIQVELTDVVVNGSYEVIQGSIGADVSSNPVDLSPFGDMPLLLQQVRFEKWSSEPYALYARASLKLPEALDEVEVSIDSIKFGPNGFEEGLFTAGSYASTYNPTTPAITQQAYENGAFTFAVTGVELEFAPTGDSFRFSGNIGSSLFQDEGNAPSLIHLSSDYLIQSGWDFTLDAQHLPNMEVDMGQAKLVLDNLDVNADNQAFEVIIDSRLRLSDVMGDDFEVGLNGLKMGTAGVSLSSLNSNAAQYLSLFNETDNLHITDLRFSIDNEVLFVALDGSLHFLERDFDFTALQIGSNGSIDLGNVQANLLQDDIELLGPQLVLKSLSLTTLNSKIALEAGGEAKMPEPFIQDKNSVSISVNYLGDTQVDIPNFAVGDVPPVDLGGFATLTLTDVGMDFDPLHLSNSAFYASAELVIPDEESGAENIIQFGSPGGDIAAAGISYQYGAGNLSYNITNTPSFTFQKSFFKLSISGFSEIDGGQTFGVELDTDAELSFDGISGSGSLLNNRIDASGISWGDFGGGDFSLAGIVDIEVGSFTHERNGGTLMLERKANQDEGPKGADTTLEPVHVDEYLQFGGSTSNDALRISMGSGGFAVAGGVEQILYYRKGNELFLAIQHVNVELSDYAELSASMEYMQDNSGFLLMVAGGAAIKAPGVDPFQVTAIGKLSTINNKLSMGIFVAAQGAPIPIIPGIVDLTGIGAGFFYNPTVNDLNLVLNYTDHNLANPPWEDVDNTSYHFAVMINGGVGFLGATNTYAFGGNALMMVTDQFMTLDTKFDMNIAPVSGNAYVHVEYPQGKVVLEAGGGVALQDMGVVRGGLGVNFTAVKQDSDPNTYWAFTGGTNMEGGEPIEILEVLETDATIILNQDGFLLDCGVGGGFDVWAITINGRIETTVWYLSTKEQFGAYAEIGVSAEVLGGLASIGGTAKGALLTEKGDFILYASLSGYVEVLYVFEGSKTVWLSMDNSGFDGGTGASGYEDLIASARRDARNMNEKAEALLTSIEEAKNAIVPLSDETLAKSGQALFMASQSEREQWGNDFIANEEQLMNPAAQEFYDMRDEVVAGGAPVDNIRADYLDDMKQGIQEVNNNSAAVSQSLQELRASAIEWDATAMEMIANLQNPVQQADTSWQADDHPPSFLIDTVQANNNVRESESLKESMDQLHQEDFQAAIDTTLANIRKIEAKLDGKVYTLSSGVEQTGVSSVQEMAGKYQQAIHGIRKYYATQISYFWALHHWAKTKKDNNTGYGSSLYNSHNRVKNEVLNALGIDFSPAAIQNQFFTSRGILTIGGVSFSENPSMGSETPGWSDLNSNEQQAVKNGLNKSENTIGRVVGKRRYLIQEMNPDVSDEEAEATRDSLEQKVIAHWNQERFFDFVEAINQSSGELYQMQLGGLSATADMGRLKADSLVDAAENLLVSLDSAHQQFTALEDEVYRIKASMMSTLYGMYEQYADWTKSTQGDSLAIPIEDKLTELESMLVPPKFNKLYYITYPGRNGYDRYLHVGWNTLHSYKSPQLSNIENSYQLEKGTSNTIYAEGFQSVGRSKVLEIHTYPEHSRHTNQDYTIRIRARGPAGNTISRYLNTTVELDPSAEVVTGDLQALVPDDTPPPMPEVSLGDKPYMHNFYWSDNPNEIAIRVVATDPESDIIKIEYAIGTSRGATDIRDWEVGYGSTVSGGAVDASSNAGQTIYARGLQLKEETSYFVSVRVTNGDGLTSSVREVYHPLRLDLDPPATPKKQLVMVAAPIVAYSPAIFQMEYQDNYVTEVPEMLAPPTNVAVAEPKISASWEAATDSLSGVRGYDYVISHQANAATALDMAGEAAFNDKNERSLNHVGDPLSFADTAYIHVWAKDYAGNRSREALTFAQLPKDPSAPGAPKATIMSKPNGLHLFIIKPSYDLESGIKGIQYAIGTSPGATDIKNWPAGEDIDELEMNGASQFVRAFWVKALEGKYSWPNSPINAPFYKIPPAGLPQGVPLYVTYRTLNKQGKKSAKALTGPVILDSSAPPSPSVSLISLSPSLMKVEASNIMDPESGVRKVEYQIQNKNEPYESKAWDELKQLNGISNSPISVNRDFLLVQSQSIVNIKFGIRITNGNGMQSTYWFDGENYSNAGSQAAAVQDYNHIPAGSQNVNNSYNFNW